VKNTVRFFYVIANEISLTTKTNRNAFLADLNDKEGYSKELLDDSFRSLYLKVFKGSFGGYWHCQSILVLHKYASLVKDSCHYDSWSKTSNFLWTNKSLFCLLCTNEKKLLYSK